MLRHLVLGAVCLLLSGCQFGQIECLPRLRGFPTLNLPSARAGLIEARGDARYSPTESSTLSNSACSRVTSVESTASPTVLFSAVQSTRLPPLAVSRRWKP